MRYHSRGHPGGKSEPNRSSNPGVLGRSLEASSAKVVGTKLKSQDCVSMPMCIQEKENAAAGAAQASFIFNAWLFGRQHESVNSECTVG